MNVQGAAVQVFFFPPVTASIKVLQVREGHTCDASFAGVGPTVQFKNTMHHWYELMLRSPLSGHDKIQEAMARRDQSIPFKCRRLAVVCIYNAV